MALTQLERALQEAHDKCARLEGRIAQQRSTIKAQAVEIEAQVDELQEKDLEIQALRQKIAALEQRSASQSALKSPSNTTQSQDAASACVGDLKDEQETESDDRKTVFLPSQQLKAQVCPCSTWLPSPYTTADLVLFAQKSSYPDNYRGGPVVGSDDQQVLPAQSQQATLGGQKAQEEDMSSVVFSQRSMALALQHNVLRSSDASVRGAQAVFSASSAGTTDAFKPSSQEERKKSARPQ